MSPIARYRLRVVLLITLIWVLIGIGIETNNALIYNPATGRYSLYFPFGNNMIQHLLITAAGPLLGGLLGGPLYFSYCAISFASDLLRTS